MPTVGEHDIREGSTDIASDATSTSSFDQRKSVCLSIAFGSVVTPFEIQRCNYEGSRLLKV